VIGDQLQPYRPWRAFSWGVALCALVTALALLPYALEDRVLGEGYLVTTIDGGTSAIDRFLVQGDGQAFAAVAADPLVEDPSVFRGGPEEAAYRAQRPLAPWSAWLLVLGQPGAVKVGLLVVNLIAGGALVVAATVLVGRRGGAPWLGIAVIATPPVVLSLSLATAEILGLALALWGVVLWTREDGSRRSQWTAVALFAATVLARESFVLIPLAIAASELIRHRRTGGPRRAAMLAVTPLPYLLWVLILRARVGAWPVGSQDGRLSLPFVGIVDAARSWGAEDYVVFALLLLSLFAAARRLDDVLSWIAWGQVPLLVLAGSLVMLRWQDFGRVFGVIYVVGVIVAGSAHFRADAYPAPSLHTTRDGPSDK
jgi:hypothetical protein